MFRSVLALVGLACLAGLVSPVSAQDKPEGKFYMIGMGTCADLVTVRGAEILEKTDLFILEMQDDKKFWADYIGDKEVYIAPHGARYFFGANIDALEDPDAKARAIEAAKQREDAVAKIREAVEDGKIVSALQWGDPMIYGTTWYLEMLPKDFPSEIIPGIGAFQAATAAVKMSPTFGRETNSVIISMADFPGREDTNSELLALKTSFVMFTMHLDYPKFIGEAKMYYPPETPIAVVEYAGIPDMEKIHSTTLGKFLDEVDYENLAPDMHLVLLGKFLTCGQARVDGLTGSVKYIDKVHGAEGEKTAPQAGK